MAELDNDRYEVAVLSNPKLSSSQFLKEVVHQLGAELRSHDKLKLMHELNNILYGNFRREKETVILIDEAQAIPNEAVFEEIRLLLNFQLNDRFLLTLLLLGQPELREKVAQIPQLAQRIAVQYHLKGLTPAETVAYIKHRLKIAGANSDMFEEESYPLIFEFTSGIPRKINTLCDLCLFEGFGERARGIGSSLVKNVIEDLYGATVSEKVHQKVGSSRW